MQLRTTADLDRQILDTFRNATFEAVEAILPLRENLELSFKRSEMYQQGQEIVTTADLLSDQILSKYISDHFRGTALVTEEQRDSHTIESDKFFTIDGLDGTICFAGKYPGAENMWGVLLALVEKGIPRLGSIYLRETGQVITVNGNTREIKVDGETRGRPTYPDRLTVAIDLGNWQSPRVEEVILPALRDAGIECLTDRPSAAGITDYLLRGRAHAWVTRVARIWDVAPLAAALPAVGGVVTPLYQNEMNWQVPYPAPAIYACTPEVAARIKEILLLLPERDRF
jgi:fructose-1,6-bisphosphatase/inositol monophosphatase family enzyme